jgi:hypothetical protein
MYAEVEKDVWKTKSLLAMADNQAKIPQEVFETKGQKERRMSENLETKLSQASVLHQVHRPQKQVLSTLCEAPWKQKNSMYVEMEGSIQ